MQGGQVTLVRVVLPVELPAIEEESYQRRDTYLEKVDILALHAMHTFAYGRFDNLASGCYVFEDAPLCRPDDARRIREALSELTLAKIFQGAQCRNKKTTYKDDFSAPVVVG